MSPSPPTVVLWDIDGTLLSTGRAGIKAWEDAVHEVLGHPTDLSIMRTSGLTDPMIARQILVASGHDPDPEVERSMLERYCQGLPGCLTPARGGVLPGVMEVLEDLQSRADVIVALLTGNMRAGARAKLDCYGLSNYFESGGFGDDGFERSEIGRVAMQRVAASAGDLDLDRVYLVGDSPYDVACSRSLGIRMIAVASGEHTTTDLDVDDPWWVLEALPGAQEFADRIFAVTV